MTRICIAGVTGWTGSAVAAAVINTEGLELVAAVARKSAGEDIGTALGLAPLGKKVSATIEEALFAPDSVDVLIEYTHASSVRHNVMCALERNVHVVVGSSGLSAADFEEVNQLALKKGLGVIAAGNFSITAALAKKFALMAAEFLPTREIIDYAGPGKADAPSGTARELAEQLGQSKANEIALALKKTVGLKEARGANVAGTQVHSLRLPGYTLAFEALYGLPDERLTIRHDAGTSAAPYVSGTLLASQKVTSIKGLVRGMDTLLFGA